MATYLISLVQGNWSQYDLSKWRSTVIAKENSLLDPSKISLESGKQQAARPMAQRVIVQKTGDCEIDGCLILKNHTFIDCLKAVNTSRIRWGISGVVSILGGTLVSGFLPLVSQHPYIQLALQVIALATAVLAGCRYRAAGFYGEIVTSKLSKEGEKFAQERTARYPENVHGLSTTIKPQEKILHPLEAESFFRQYFLEWAKPLLEQTPKTPKEKDVWVMRFISSLFNSPLRKSTAQKFLIEGCVAPSNLMKTLEPVFAHYEKFESSANDKSKAAGYAQQLFQTAQIIWKSPWQNPQISSALCRCMQRIDEDSIWIMDGKKHVLQITREYISYCLLATEAILQNPLTPLLTRIRRDLFLAQVPYAIYYETARQLLEATRQIVVNGKQEVPAMGVLGLCNLPPIPQMPQTPLALDGQFYERAKSLKVTEGLQEEYEQFIEEIRTPGSLKNPFQFRKLPRV